MSRVIEEGTLSREEIDKAIKHAVKTGETLTFMRNGKVASQIVTPRLRLPPCEDPACVETREELARVKKAHLELALAAAELLPSPPISDPGEPK